MLGLLSAGLFFLVAPGASAQETAARSGSTTAPIRGDVPPEHPLQPAIRLAEDSLRALDDVRDYEATLTKKERVGPRMIVHAMHLKFREEPFSVYLRFVGENAGREVLYVEGRYNNMLLAREAAGLKSLVGTISLAPTSREVMSESRYPITTIGLRNIAAKLIERWQQESKYGEIDVKYYHHAKLGERPCLVIEVAHPQPRRQFKFHLTRLFLDRETNFPVRVENHDWPARPGDPPVLVEEYTYTDIRTNVGLTDLDFDRTNPKYSF